jgi:hypothetical protein
MATIQDAVEVSIAYAKESTFGTAASASGGKYIRRVSTNLAVSKDSFQSNEVRTDAEVSDLRHGVRRVGGNIESELSLQTWDDWLESLLRGTWAAGLTASQTDFTSVVASASAGTFTFAGGDPVTKGLRIGDVFRFTSGVVSPNVNKNFRITGFGGTSNRTVSVTPSPYADIGTAVTTFALAVTGKKLVTGVTKDSYTVEKILPELDISERYVGCRISQGSFSMPPNGMATASWEIMGQDGTILTGASSPYFTTIAAAPNTGIFAGTSGSLRLNGAERAVLTSFQLNINNNCSTTPVCFANVAPDVFYGRRVVTGSVSAFLENEGLINAFMNESEVDLTAQLDLSLASGATAAEFLVFNMQRVKFSSYTSEAGADGGVIATFQFQALLATAGSGKDGTSLTIQRSNT